MRNSKFGRIQIVVPVQTVEAETQVKDAHRESGNSEATCCARKLKYSGMEASEVRQL